MKIRSARGSDTSAMYAIALATGDEGADASGLHRYPDLIGEVYVGPYLALAPEHAFALVDDRDTPVGYALGVADTHAFENRLATEWWPPARRRTAGCSLPTPADLAMLTLIASPPTAPADLLTQYPAHGHINLLPRAQGHGQGRALLSRVMASLAGAGAPGMHLEVGGGNLAALAFYERMGFGSLRSTGDSVFVGRLLPTP